MIEFKSDMEVSFYRATADDIDVCRAEIEKRIRDSLGASPPERGSDRPLNHIRVLRTHADDPLAPVLYFSHDGRRSCVDGHLVTEDRGWVDTVAATREQIINDGFTVEELKANKWKCYDALGRPRLWVVSPGAIIKPGPGGDVWAWSRHLKGWLRISFHGTSPLKYAEEAAGDDLERVDFPLHHRHHYAYRERYYHVKPDGLTVKTRTDDGTFFYWNRRTKVWQRCMFQDRAFEGMRDSLTMTIHEIMGSDVVQDHVKRDICPFNPDTAKP